MGYAAHEGTLFARFLGDRVVPSARHARALGCRSLDHVPLPAGAGGGLGAGGAVFNQGRLLLERVTVMSNTAQGGNGGSGSDGGGGGMGADGSDSGGGGGFNPNFPASDDGGEGVTIAFLR